MFEDFKQFVDSSVCLKCDGCCRFKEAESRWRPYIAQTERKSVAGHITPADGKIKTVPCADGFICCFFDNKENSCGIYHARPFECQLYPFLLGKENGQPALYAHLNCPYVQKHFGTPLYKEYVAYLREFFSRKNVLAFLRANPLLFADYSDSRDELDYIGAICLEPF